LNTIENNVKQGKSRGWS